MAGCGASASTSCLQPLTQGSVTVTVPSFCPHYPSYDATIFVLLTHPYQCSPGIITLATMVCSCSWAGMGLPLHLPMPMQTRTEDGRMSDVRCLTRPHPLHVDARMHETDGTIRCLSCPSVQSSRCFLLTCLFLYEQTAWRFLWDCNSSSTAKCCLAHSIGICFPHIACDFHSSTHPSLTHSTPSSQPSQGVLLAG